MEDWHIYKGTGQPHDGISRLVAPPPWRDFAGSNLVDIDLGTDPKWDRLFKHSKNGLSFQVNKDIRDMVNAALYLRRPLLITGKPGTGKSTLAHAVAHELMLGPVLRWSITSRSSLEEGLYQYDAIGRLQQASLVEKMKNSDDLQYKQYGNTVGDIGRFIRLGPLGTALLASVRPRVLLIDEIDKSNIDLPNDLLNVFEEGEFRIPELERLPADDRSSLHVQTFDTSVSKGKQPTVPVKDGYIQCKAFPFVVLTSNGERELPPAFLRRCLRLTINEPDKKSLEQIVRAHLGETVDPQTVSTLIDKFIEKRDKVSLSTDQLLNAVYIVNNGLREHTSVDKDSLIDSILKDLNST